MTKTNVAFDFELALYFNEYKDPSQAFSQMAKMYEQLLDIDKHVLYNIYPDAHIKYELTDIEFSSIKSKVRQILEAIPDDVLKDVLNPSKLFGHLLVFVKHRILKAIENNEVQSKKELEALTKEINKEIKNLKLPKTIVLEVNNYFILNALNELSKEAQKLKKSEAYEYKSSNGSVRLKNNARINMGKILSELGEQKLEQERTEKLKVKVLDFISDKSKWKLIRRDKPIDVKILDKQWLEDFHNRKIEILANDYLEVELKITYTTRLPSLKPIVLYEATKVHGIIPPNKIEFGNPKGLFEE